MRSLESRSRSRNLDMSKNPEGSLNSKQKDPWDMSEFTGKKSLRDMIAELEEAGRSQGTEESEKNEELEKNEEPEEQPVAETWDDHVEQANFLKYQAIWEKEKAEADKSGINPETGLYEKGRATIDPQNLENVESRKQLAMRQSNGEQLTLTEIMKAGRDGTIYEWNGYKLKPNCCYRKISEKTLEYYQKSGFVDNNIDLRTLERKDGATIKGRVDTVDWFLGTTTPRYGNILIETPASQDYFVPVEKPGHTGNLLTDTEALHMHSSGIVDPIPMSKVRVIRGWQDSSNEELSEKLKKGEISLSDISSTF